MNDVLVGKVIISASLKKINFPKISEQASLKYSQPSGHQYFKIKAILQFVTFKLTVYCKWQYILL